MALTFNRVLETADEAKVLCDDVTRVLSKIERFLAFNSDQAIDWGAQETPAYITEDQDGNIQGRRYSRQDVSNVIGSLDWVRKLLNNQSMTGSQGDHLGNLNKLAQPMPIR